VAPAVSEPALQIIGREPELEVLTAAVDAAAEAGRTLAVCGEPGIGKSVLIQAAARRGRERGYLVLRATGVEAESRLPFAGLHELLCPLLEAADALAPPQRRALLSAFRSRGRWFARALLDLPGGAQRADGCRRPSAGRGDRR
jgi:hypothetical protein